jgi:hypothetical protein
MAVWRHQCRSVNNDQPAVKIVKKMCSVKAAKKANQSIERNNGVMKYYQPQYHQQLGVSIQRSGVIQ